MSIFTKGKGLNDPSNQPGTGRLFLSAGRYTLQVDRLKAKDASQSFKGHDSFIAELTVLRSDNPEILEGAQVSWVQKLSGRSQNIGFATVKEFFASLLGPDGVAALPKDDAGNIDWAGHAELACSEANPYGQVRARVDCLCVAKPMKDSDKVFTVHMWRSPGSLWQS